MTEGIDKNGNLHDERGQFISISTLFERERQEHGRDHEQERLIARDTAQRLEREVEETARRLERLVDETALRLEKGVVTALEAVAKTAQVHSEAHNREHQAHERIHAVEKEQVMEARRVVDKRLDQMNEFRGALEDQASKAVPREYYDSRHEDLRERIAAADKILDEKIAALESFKGKALGFGALLSLLSGVAGAIIMKVVGG